MQQSGQKGLEKIPLSFTCEPILHVHQVFDNIMVCMCFKSEYQIFYLQMSLTSLMVVGTGRHGRGVLTQ